MVKRKNTIAHKRASHRIGIISMIIGLMLVASIGYTIFALTNPTQLCFGTLFHTREHVENFSHVQFPESATNIRYELRESGALAAPTCTIWLQFKINPEDFEQFSTSTLIDSFAPNPLEHNDFFNYHMEEMNWSQPESVLAGYDYLPCCSPEISQWIFIDTSDADSWIVRVITNEYWLD